MNQADVTKLMSQLRIALRGRHRNLKNIDGPEGRLNKLRKIVTGLIKNERIELNTQTADESRQYAERLISDAIRYGDCHRPTMEMADFWLHEKQLVHKLFKVLVPRYENCHLSYTRMYKAPREAIEKVRPRSVVELRGNPFPPLGDAYLSRRSLLHNVLLEEAKRDRFREKIDEVAPPPKPEQKIVDELETKPEKSPSS